MIFFRFPLPSGTMVSFQRFDSSISSTYSSKYAFKYCSTYPSTFSTMLFLISKKNVVGGGYEELIQWGNGVPLYRAFGTLGGEFRLFQHVLLKIGYEFVYTTPHGLSKNEKKKM